MPEIDILVLSYSRIKKILRLKPQYIFFLYYLLLKIEIYMNQIKKFIILKIDLVLTYILQQQT